MAVVVLKFGGSSLRNLNEHSNVLNHIRDCIDEGDYPVVVVSAMGRRGDPYATDTLIELLEEIESEICPRKKDLIMSCGEVISAVVVSHLLEVNNIPAEPLTGFQAGIFTNEEFGSAEIIDIDVSNINRLIDEGKIPIVAGFQGITKEGEVTTLGRGGSDITAIQIGGYLKAKEINIFTDVPGIALIDPNLVPYTEYMKTISYDNMYKLALNGVKVLHPKSVQMAKKFNIPVRVTSTFEKTPGTIIGNEEEDKRIIGIAVTDDYIEHIFKIYFYEEYRKSIIKDMKVFLENKDRDILSIKFNTDSITLKTNTKDVPKFSKDLYDHLLN